MVEKFNSLMVEKFRFAFALHTVFICTSLLDTEFIPFHITNRNLFSMYNMCSNVIDKTLKFSQSRHLKFSSFIQHTYLMNAS